MIGLEETLRRLLDRLARRFWRQGGYDGPVVPPPPFPTDLEGWPAPRRLGFANGFVFGLRTAAVILLQTRVGRELRAEMLAAELADQAFHAALEHQADDGEPAAGGFQ